MQAIVQNETEKTIDMAKLRSLIPPYCAVRTYDSLRGKTLKQVMGKYTVLIILWNIHNKAHRVLNQAGHFFVLSVRGPEKVPVIFSSTGMSYKKELFITQSDPNIFERILPKDTLYNQKRLQLNNDSNTCWRWAIVFTHLCPMGLKKFQQLFSRPTIHLTNPDTLVTALTLLSLY
jgi:hypothetical protein